MATPQPAGRVAVTLVTGFLGSGKTTLLNVLLRARRDVRIAALVNDFGQIGLDHELVDAVGDQMVALSNGCICCTINDDLRASLDRVLALEPPVEAIVIETTGVADPVPVAATLLAPGLKPRLRLDTVVTLVDGENFKLEMFQEGAAASQIALADVIVLNKCDLVSVEQLDALEGRLHLFRSSARILRAVNAVVPLALLEGPGDVDQRATQETGHDHHDHHDHLARDGFRSVSFQSERALDGRAFQRFLWNEVPREIFRAKGVVRLQGSDARHVFHLVGGRTTFESGTWTGPPRTAAVFIGRDFDEERLRRDFERCLTPEVPR